MSDHDSTSLKREIIVRDTSYLEDTRRLYSCRWSSDRQWVRLVPSGERSGEALHVADHAREERGQRGDGSDILGDGSDILGDGSDIRGDGFGYVR